MVSVSRWAQVFLAGCAGRSAVATRGPPTSLYWLPHLDAVAPDHTIAAMKEAARDPALDRQIDAIEAEMFAPPHQAQPRSPRHLRRRLEAARRDLRRVLRTGPERLPRDLNPTGT